MERHTGFVLRPLGRGDLDMHLSAIDDEQMTWLWETGDREKWLALSPAEQRERQRRYLEHCEQLDGPKWVFALDTPETPYAVYVDCDLANPHVPHGLANISYTCHPAYRRRGYTTVAVLKAYEFLKGRTAEAHILTDVRNEASRRVAISSGAQEVERFVDDEGRTMVRHVRFL